MPTHYFPLTILTQEFEDETFLAEALNFYEVSRFHTNRETAIYNVRLNAEQTLKDAYANLLHTRIAPENIEIREVLVEIAPPKKSEAWRETIELKFHALCSVRDDGYFQAFVPALRIQIITKKEKEFDAKIRKEILSALKRNGWLKSLEYLRRLESTANVTITKEEIAVTLPTAKQRAIAEEKGETEDKSVLNEVGTNLEIIHLRKAYEAEKQVEKLAEVFKAKQKSSILLVGASGVGKTAIFHELVTNRKNLGLEDKEFWATGGARLIAGQAGFGMWQERCGKLVEEAKKRDAILHLGNLVELLEVGKSMSSTQGIASFLRPKIARGEIVTVVECTPEQIPVLERRDPNLLSAFSQIVIEEPDKETSLKILQSVAREFKRKYDAQAVKAVENLHRRFSTYSAFPGRPVRFLRNLFQEIDADETVSVADVYKSFSNETGLPEMLLNDRIGLDLKQTEKFFAGKVLGQTDAVTLVTKMIATVKTRLTRPRKPIASLLFIGPTGVGKTELTKALAEFFFSDAARLIRFDMSEYSNALAVQRLIGGTGEAEGILTAKVREQPFSVVLLDEFEKAHHSFFDLLLQMLGEGRLTDSFGRVADFTNAIIVMTSNLGATEFRRGNSGFTRNARERSAAIKHFDSAVKNFLRPEIYNRLDRIVPFAPLDEKTVLKVAELEIEKLKKRDGLYFRSVKLEIEQEVLNYLAETGYDIRYGARPLRRTIERELLAPVSAEMNLRSPDEKLLIKTTVENGKIALEFTSETNRKKSSQFGGLIVTQAERIANLRRRMQKFSASYKLTELRDEIYQIVRLEALELRGKWISEEDRERITRKPKLQYFLDESAKFAAEINSFEDEILFRIYGKTSAENSSYSNEIVAKEKLFSEYLFRLLSLQYVRPNEIKLSFFSENAPAMFRLVRMYLEHLKELKGEVKKVLFFTSHKQPDQEPEPFTLFDRQVWRKEILTDAKTFRSSPSEVLGILLELEAELALPRFGAESGVHRFTTGTKTDRILVGTTEAVFEKFALSEDLAKRDSLRFKPDRRIYDSSKLEVKDLNLDKKYSLESADVEKILVKAIEENLQNTADNLIE